MTYPAPEVDALLARELVCHVVDTRRPTREGRELLRRFRLLWEPGLVFCDGTGVELRRVVGYRGPRAFVAETRLALAQHALLHRRLERSLEHLEAARQVDHDAETAPEALFWTGIVRYRLAHRDIAVLVEAWRTLEREFPNSRWWKAADVFDAVPTGTRRSGSAASRARD